MYIVHIVEKSSLVHSNKELIAVACMHSHSQSNQLQAQYSQG